MDAARAAARARARRSPTGRARPRTPRELGLNALAQAARRARLTHGGRQPSAVRPPAPDREPPGVAGAGSPCCTSGSRTSSASPRPRRTSCAATPGARRARARRSAAGSTPTRSAPRRPTRRRCSRPERRSRRCAAAASRSPGRPATTRGRGRRWASASSTRSRSRRGGRRPSSGSGASRSSTGTSTTATARRTIVGDDPTILFVSLHQWPFYPGTGGPGRAGRDAGQHAARRRHRRRGVPRRVRARRARDRRVRARAAARLGRVRRPRRGPAAQLELSTERLRELARRASALAPRVAAVLEGGYNLETLPDLVEAALDGFSLTRASVSIAGSRAGGPPRRDGDRPDEAADPTRSRATGPAAPRPPRRRRACARAGCSRPGSRVRRPGSR